MEDTQNSFGGKWGKRWCSRAVYIGVLTIDVRRTGWSMEEQEKPDGISFWMHIVPERSDGPARGIENWRAGGWSPLHTLMVSGSLSQWMKMIQPSERRAWKCGYLKPSGPYHQTIMLGCDIDFIIKDLDNKSRSVVASEKMQYLKRQTFISEKIQKIQCSMTMESVETGMIHGFLWLHQQHVPCSFWRTLYLCCSNSCDVYDLCVCSTGCGCCVHVYCTMYVLWCVCSSSEK